MTRASRCSRATRSTISAVASMPRCSAQAQTSATHLSTVSTGTVRNSAARWEVTGWRRTAEGVGDAEDAEAVEDAEDAARVGEGPAKRVVRTGMDVAFLRSFPGHPPDVSARTCVFIPQLISGVSTLGAVIWKAGPVS